jgi:hypothetical protein
LLLPRPVGLSLPLPVKLACYWKYYIVIVTVTLLAATIGRIIKLSHSVVLPQ